MREFDSASELAQGGHDMNRSNHSLAIQNWVAAETTFGKQPQCRRVGARTNRNHALCPPRRFSPEIIIFPSLSPACMSTPASARTTKNVRSVLSAGMVSTHGLERPIYRGCNSIFGAPFFRCIPKQSTAYRCSVLCVRK